MPITISVKHDLDRLTRNLREHREQIPFAASLAINNTLFLLLNRQKNALNNYIEGGPTPFTSRGFRVVKSTRGNLVGRFLVEPTRWNYLRRIVQGSNQQRRLVPNLGRGVNKYGNLPRTYVRTRRTKPSFFYGRPRNQPRKPFGLYRRLGRGIALQAGWFGNVKHGRSYPYFVIARNVVEREFPREFAKSLDRAIRTAR